MTDFHLSKLDLMAREPVDEDGSETIGLQRTDGERLASQSSQYHQVVVKNWFC